MHQGTGRRGEGRRTQNAPGYREEGRGTEAEREKQTEKH